MIHREEVNEQKHKYIDDTDQFSFELEPIRGYPELRWTGKRPFKGTSYYPAQLKETHGDTVDGWRNKIFWGDNLQVMSHLLRQYRGKVKLIYIDPPFDSKADYKKKIELRGVSAANDTSAFEEKQYTDIWTNDEYLQFMYERLILLRELLADDGSIYVHVDWKVVSYLKIIMDEVFGFSSFHNGIVWKANPGHSDSELYGQMQNIILFYSKGEKPFWNQMYQPYDEEYLESHYQKIDNEGRRFEDTDLTAAGLSGGGYDYEWNGHRKIWRCPIETMRELGQKDQIYYTRNGLARSKRFLDTMEGAPLSDLWIDIPRLNSQASEKEGYPTQKPEALLERIMKASSNPGDLVFDCFMGSGTTQAVAMKLGRRFLGADINLGAIQTTTKRLLQLAAEIRNNQVDQKGSLELSSEAQPLIQKYTGFQIYNVNHYDFFRNEVQARELLLEALEVQRFPGNNLWDGEKDGCMVKVLGINRLATAADLNSVLGNLDLRTWERRARDNPTQPVERIRFVCMGHDPDLKAQFLAEMDKLGYKVDLEVFDILRDKQELHFKRDSEARIAIEGSEFVVQEFYPMNLLQKLSMEQTQVADWRELVDSILIDFNYDGTVFTPTLDDIPGKRDLVKGRYPIPSGAGTIKVKITDLLSESWEGTVEAT